MSYLWITLDIFSKLSVSQAISLNLSLVPIGSQFKSNTSWTEKRYLCGYQTWQHRTSSKQQAARTVIVHGEDLPSGRYLVHYLDDKGQMNLLPLFNAHKTQFPNLNVVIARHSTHIGTDDQFIYFYGVELSSNKCVCWLIASTNVSKGYVMDGAPWVF
jgi:hypothetical protein